MRYKAELEKILTAQLQMKEPGPLSQVAISDDGKYAVLQTAGRHRIQKLSKYGAEYLRNGEAVLVEGESFLEPE